MGNNVIYLLASTVLHMLPSSLSTYQSQSLFMSTKVKSVKSYKNDRAMFRSSRPEVFNIKGVLIYAANLQEKSAIH